MRVLIAPDKFKGTLTAREAASAIASGWRRVRPKDMLELLPISDGGDGFGSVLADVQGIQPVKTRTVDAAGRRCSVRWWWDATKCIAIIESARVIGLAMLPPGKFHPFELDTQGLARVLRAATKRGAQCCVIGLGGSATNDGGFGMARGLGWKFLDQSGNEIRKWPDLVNLARIEAPAKRCWPAKVIAAVDVQNPLLGARGCTRIYGPQKGLHVRDYPKCDAALHRLALVVRKEFGETFRLVPGMGAAGGLGFGLVAFAGGWLQSGFAMVEQAARLRQKIQQADIVVTGEGRLDRSTLMGKAVGELAERCSDHGVDCIALGGSIKDRGLLIRKFSFVGALTDLTTRRRAQPEAKLWLKRLASNAAGRIKQ